LRNRSDRLEGFERRRRRLPHWEGPGETYFLTFRLMCPDFVDLTQERIGRLVVEAIMFFADVRYELYDYTIMPDHVHLILKPIVHDGKAERLANVTHSLKSWLASRINRIVGRSGQLWQHESYDHIVRDEADYQEKAAYIFDNPKRAGLVNDPAEWPWWGVGPRK